VREVIGIHAGKRKLTRAERQLLERYPLPEGHQMQFGAIVATAKIVECQRMDRRLILAQTRQERALGIWEAKRFAWFLEEVQMLEEPIPARGKQMFWNFDLEGKT